MSEFWKGFLAGTGVGIVSVLVIACGFAFSLVWSERRAEIERMRADD